VLSKIEPPNNAAIARTQPIAIQFSDAKNI
jgi:hypothetical protein